jgi:long-chain acyl-CoA synthetase
MTLKKFGTLVENFCYWEKQTPSKIYLSQPVDGQWIDYSWAETGNQVRRMANYLKSLDLPIGSNIALVSKNCAHWIMADLAIGLAGHVSVPLYPTLVADQIEQVLTHSGCKVLFIGKLDDWKSMKAGISSEIHTIAFPKMYSGCPADEFINWDNIVAQHEPLTQNPTTNPDDIATIVYTSGTTGVPKGVMIAHKHIVDATNETRLNARLDIVGARFFSYLPLCHIAERNIVESASAATGGTVFFAESLETFAQNLQYAMPTHFLAVPRIWTKFQLGILGKMDQKKLNTLLKIPIVSGLVRKKIKAGLGLTNAQIILTGAAPMPPELIAWYARLGIKIQEAYGMTENLGACTMMPPDGIKSGTVGKSYNGVEIRIDPDTGEIQMKAVWNTLGYYKEPVLTKDLFTADGWLRTGDAGQVDGNGYLKITGRVKDIFKTSKGEYVAPTPIENEFAMNPFIEQICVTGSMLPQPIALVVLSDIGKGSDREEVADSIRATMTAANPKFKNYEHIRKVIVLKEAWTVENNLMTPTMKIKRNVIESRFSEQMPHWYDVDDTVMFE